MKNSLLQIVFYAIVLVLCGALEEFLPKCFGVGFPILLLLTGRVALEKSVPTLLLFAITAGAFEDALSSLPPLTSPCFFLIVALCVWRTHLEKAVLIFAYPIYEIWLTLIAPNTANTLGVRIPMAFVFAALALFIVGSALTWLERKAVPDAE